MCLLRGAKIIFGYMLVWDLQSSGMLTQSRLIISFRRFGTTCRFRLQGSSFLDCLILEDGKGMLSPKRRKLTMYEGCPESIQPFWISPKPVDWPWYNLAASQRTPYCAFLNSHSPVGLVSRQWDAVDWACVLCDRRTHKSPPFQRRFQFWEKPKSQGAKSGL